LRGYRSFFWPAVLILVGVVALLVNTGRIPVDRLYQLLYLWPLILIVIGLELIVRRTMRGTSADVAAALIVLLAIAGAAGYVTIAPNPAATSSRDFSGDIAGVTHGSVAIAAGAATITISAGVDLGADQYRAHVEFSGLGPTVTFDSGGQLNIDELNNRSIFGIQDQKFVVNLQLNPDIPWSISEKTGASNDTLQLGSLHVGSITLKTGASRDDITLGPPSGIVPVEIDGGALTVDVHRLSGTEASVAVSGGAVTLTADGRDLHGFGDLSYESPGFAGATDGYRIHVKGGACTVTLDTGPSD
jgi:hypothetical protein